MRRFITLVTLVLAVSSVFAQDPYRAETSFAVTLSPNVIVPLPTETAYFNIGGGADISMDLPLPFLPAVAPRVMVGYEFLPIWSGDGANLMKAAGGLAFDLPLPGSVRAELFAGGGYYYGVIADESNASGGNALLTGGVRLGWRARPAFDQGLEVRYEAGLDGLGGLLYHGVSVGLSTRLNTYRQRELRIEELQFESVFPVLYKSYTEQPIGSLVLVNDSANSVEDLNVAVYVEEFMDAPWNVPAPTQIPGNERLPLDLVGLFSESAVMAITESTVSSAVVSVRYTQDNREHTVDGVAQVRILDRHAMTWDDDRKASAYVTYKDPVIVDLASVLSRVAGTAGDVLDRNLRTAVALHEALREYGIDYRTDPTTPFIEMSQNDTAIDYLQFPRNTLQRRTGDCDDLAILYASLLQATGIDTAFLTIPGHIFLAFALDMSLAEARASLSDPDDVIEIGGRGWVPIEITLVNSSFMEAWRTGATEWRASVRAGTAAYHVIPEAWRTYEPVAQVGEYDTSSFVSEDRIEQGFREEMDRLVNREITALSGRLIERRDSGRASTRDINRLGSIYARYGRRVEAEELFREAAAEGDYFPAVANLASLLFLEGQLPEARQQFERALAMSPEHPVVLLQLARLHSELGEFDLSADYYERLRTADPELAEEHRYLDLSLPTPERASSRSRSGRFAIWVEED